MPGKVKEALSRAANNFQRADIRVLEEPQVSVAEHRGLKPPPLSNAQRAGYAAEGALAMKRFEASVAATERFREEKAAFEKARDDVIMARIQARQVWI